METSSLLSSLNDECKSDHYIEPHYKEWYRVAVDTLIEHGVEAYQEFLTKERVSDFLAEEEVSYILGHVQKLVQSPAQGTDGSCDDTSSSGTYWPLESDVEAPDLDLGWPYVMPGLLGGTQVELLFHPPRAQLLTIKETVRKMIRDARKVIALVMDIFTDVDIFKEIVEASTRGISVYILLDESNFCHFLKMTERQGCQIQRLRNIRVRTVKGQDYLSKTGAKFHGKLEQKFLLVDCQKVMYGSYSYMWSFEKAHLSMAQLIAGQLVESFDEEFRTLYARSCVPGALAAAEPAGPRPGRARWENGLGHRSLSSLASVCSQRSALGGRDPARRLDAGCFPHRGLGAPFEPDKYGPRNHEYRPHFPPPLNGAGLAAARALRPGAVPEGWKRHSYAGEPSEPAPYLLPGRFPPRPGPAPPAWSRPSDALSVASASSRAGGQHHAPSLTLLDGAARRPGGPLAERRAPVRRSFHGTDSHVRALQLRMPTLERTAKSFLRTWRLESYLNDRADAAPDPGDAAAPDGAADGPGRKAGALQAHSRLRASFVFKPTLPEQKEVSSCTTGSSNSTIIGSQSSDTPGRAPDSPAAPQGPPEDEPAAPPAPPTPATPDHRGVNGHAEPNPRILTAIPAATLAPPTAPLDPQLLKRRSFPSFEHARAGAEPRHGGAYSTLTRSRARPAAPAPAAAAPPLTGARSLLDVTLSPAAADGEPGAAPRPAPGRHAPATKSVSIAALLDAKEEARGAPSPRKDGRGSPSFLKKGSQKLRSLLSLAPERKDGLARGKAPAFYRLCSSSDTLASEGGEDPAPRRSEPRADAPSPPAARPPRASPSPGSVHRSREDVRAAPGERPPLERPGDASAPRFNTEQIQYRDARDARPAAAPSASPAPRPRPSELLRSHSAQRRVYSRFEPFCQLEGAMPAPGGAVRAQALRPERAAASAGSGFGRPGPGLGYGAGAGTFPTYTPPENKLRGFMHRFGNLITKNK
ncbi:protein FAM83B [Dipodomys merriami]|uniref:protein FAM83B n=1 Tax=Dipodomys merriami TaxID=94247 RepID=UPI00384BCCE7